SLDELDELRDFSDREPIGTVPGEAWVPRPVHTHQADAAGALPELYSRGAAGQGIPFGPVRPGGRDRRDGLDGDSQPNPAGVLFAVGHRHQRGARRVRAPYGGSKEAGDSGAGFDYARKRLLQRPRSMDEETDRRPGPAGRQGCRYEIITANHIQGPLLNNFNIGGYLIHYLFPQHRVYVDSRPEAYTA